MNAHARLTSESRNNQTHIQEAAAVARAGDTDSAKSSDDVRAWRNIQNRWISRLRSTNGVREGQQIHAHVIRAGLGSARGIQTNLLPIYAQCGVAEDAIKLFDEIRFPALLQWNLILASCVANKKFKHAIQLYRRMIMQSNNAVVKPDSYTFCSVLRAAARERDLELGRSIHRSITQDEIRLNPMVANALLVLYTKCERIYDARQVFDEMRNKNAISWNIIIGGLSQNGQWNAAVEMFSEMQRLGFCPNTVTWNSVIAGCSQNGKHREALLYLRRMRASGADLVPVTLVSALPACARLRHLGAGREIHAYALRMALLGIKKDDPQCSSHSVESRVDHMKPQCSSRPGESWDDHMEPQCPSCPAASRDDHLESQCSSCLVESRDDHLEPQCSSRPADSGDDHLEPPCLFCLADSKDDRLEPQCSSRPDNLEDDHLEPQCSSHLVESQGNQVEPQCQAECQDHHREPQCSSCPGKCQDHCREPQCSLWPADSWDHHRESPCSSALPWSLKEQWISENLTCFPVFTPRLESTSFDLRNKHLTINPCMNLSGGEILQNALIFMYAKCGCPHEAFRIFLQNSGSSVQRWNSIISGFVGLGLFNESLRLLQKMALERGFRPNYVTAMSILPAVGRLALLRQGTEIHGFLLRNAFRGQVSLENAVIDMYCKCGNVAYARLVFDRMRDRDLLSWTGLIAGYGLQGMGRVSVKLFEKMLRSGFEPDGIAFVAVLSACSHSGLVAEARNWFSVMQKDYSIVPAIEHHSCMVDLLARAGYLNEAEDYIYGMGIEWSPEIWCTLLASCRVHSNVEVGERAAQRLFRLRPKNSGFYALLSNIYSETQRWDDVAKVRKAMKDQGLRKCPGWSFIDVAGKIHEFRVADTRHPQSEAIYATLSKLNAQMKEHGYVPNTRFVLHDYG